MEYNGPQLKQHHHHPQFYNHHPQQRHSQHQNNNSSPPHPSASPTTTSFGTKTISPDNGNIVPDLEYKRLASKYDTIQDGTGSNGAQSASVGADYATPLSLTPAKVVKTPSDGSVGGWSLVDEDDDEVPNLRERSESRAPSVASLAPSVMSNTSAMSMSSFQPAVPDPLTRYLIRRRYADTAKFIIWPECRFKPQKHQGVRKDDNGRPVTISESEMRRSNSSSFIATNLGSSSALSKSDTERKAGEFLPAKQYTGYEKWAATHKDNEATGVPDLDRKVKTKVSKVPLSSEGQSPSPPLRSVPVESPIVPKISPEILRHQRMNLNAKPEPGSTSKTGEGSPHLRSFPVEPPTVPNFAPVEYKQVDDKLNKRDSKKYGARLEPGTKSGAESDYDNEPDSQWTHL